MKIIGITGGIGSGKSTASSALRDLGAAVLDADIISRNVTAPGGKAYDELVEYFGKGIVREDGELNRELLAELAFSDRVKQHALNCITHKYIVEKIYDTIEILRNNNKCDIAVIDAPIPLEKGFLDLADEVWVIAADRELRIKRAMDRSGYSYEDVVRRIEAQPADEEYKKLADEVIYNNGTPEELEQAIVRLFLQKKQEWQRQNEAN